MKIIDKNNFYSVTEVAEILDISRTAVIKKIHKGQLKAEKIGSYFGISKSEFGRISGRKLSEQQKKILEAGVKKTVEEYGETLEKLGKE